MKRPGWLIYVLFVGGCITLMGFGSLPREQYVQTHQLSAPMEPGTTFSVDIPNGSISVHESDEEAVRMTATVTARAVGLEKARELAEATTIELAPGRGGVETRIEYPHTVRNESVRVDIDVYVPANSTVDARSQNGNVNVADYDGNLKVKNYNGEISTRNTNGDTDLETYNGRISCDDISGNIKLRSYNGHIRAAYRKGADTACDISMTTYNGGIELVTPQDFSASVQVSTHNGTITTDLPISVVGKVVRNQLKGTIGTGEGRLHLETYNGSVEIR